MTMMSIVTVTIVIWLQYLRNAMAIQIKYSKNSELGEPVRVNLSSWPKGVFTLIIGLICKF